jgi:hypothetical protein
MALVLSDMSEVEAEKQKKSIPKQVEELAGQDKVHLDKVVESERPKHSHKIAIDFACPLRCAKPETM